MRLDDPRSTVCASPATDELEKLAVEETEKWSSVIRAANIKRE
jgi:hypothetical protein